jgi:dUTP pyrophosphatase
MEIKVKKLSDKAVLPKFAKHGDAGADLVCTDRILHFGNENESSYIQCKTDLSFEIPNGYVGLLFPRSSSVKKDLILGNCVGVLDSGYRGEVSFKYKVLASKGLLDRKAIYEIGDRIGQIIILPYPEIQYIEVDELSDSERGESGWGSTGN